MKNHYYKYLIYLLVLTIMTTGCRTMDPVAKETKLQESVTDFGKALETWSTNKGDAAKRLDVHKYVLRSSEVDCQLMRSLVKKYPPKKLKDSTNVYKIEPYRTNLNKWFRDNNNAIVTLHDITPMSSKEIEQQFTNSIKLRKIMDDHIVFKGNLSIKKQQGTLPTNTTDSVTHEEVYIVNKSKSKIAEITYLDIDTKTGKARIDWSALEEEQTVGGTLNWSPNWYGFTFSYSWPFFMLNADLGFNTDKDKVTQEKLDMTDVLNYTKETITYDPYLYLTVTPAVYLKYVAIGCGVGGMLSDKTISGTKASASYTGNETSNTYKTSLKPYDEEPMDPTPALCCAPPSRDSSL